MQKVGDNEYWWNLSINTAQKGTPQQTRSSHLEYKRENVQYR